VGVIGIHIGQTGNRHIGVSDRSNALASEKVRDAIEDGESG
jgi:hypothetical protein